MLSEIPRYNLEPREVSPEIVAEIPRLYAENEKALIEQAVVAEQGAESWRKVHIGCTILALDKNLDVARPRFYSGANKKLVPGMRPWPKRQCAEMQAIKQALDNECKFIPAIVTVSKTNNSGETGFEDHDVAHPCQQCQVFLGKLEEKGIVNAKTKISSFRIEDGKPVAGEAIELGALFEKFSRKKQEQYNASLREFLLTKDTEVELYLEKWEIINIDIEQKIAALESSGNSDIFENEVLLREERLERMIQVRQECITNIHDAWLSALEEGVTKEDLNLHFRISEVDGAVPEDVTIEDVRAVLKKLEGDKGKNLPE